MADGAFLDVNIFGNEYRVACALGEQEALEAAVGFVDQRMTEISGKSKTASAERVAVMAALNIAHEFLSWQASQSEGFDTAQLKRRMKDMEARLEGLLANGKS